MQATLFFPRQPRSKIYPFGILTNQTQELHIYHIAPTDDLNQQNNYEEDKQGIPSAKGTYKSNCQTIIRL